MKACISTPGIAFIYLGFHFFFEKSHYFDSHEDEKTMKMDKNDEVLDVDGRSGLQCIYCEERFDPHGLDGGKFLDEVLEDWDLCRTFMDAGRFEMFLWQDAGVGTFEACGRCLASRPHLTCRTCREGLCLDHVFSFDGGLYCRNCLEEERIRLEELLDGSEDDELYHEDVTCEDCGEPVEDEPIIAFHGRYYCVHCAHFKLLDVRCLLKNLP